MNPFLSLLSLLFALFFGVGGGTATEESGSTQSAPGGEPPANAAGAPSEPPPIVLASRAGRQTGVLLRYSVETDGGGYGGETASTRPAKVTVARPGENVSITMLGIAPTERVVLVRELGCRHRALSSLVLPDDREHWTTPSRPGAYELEVAVPHFEPAEGGTGSASALFGLLVAPTREPAVIAAARDLFVCSPAP
jgi:hypothetical protein